MLSIRWQDLSKWEKNIAGRNRRSSPRVKTRGLVKHQREDSVNKHISNLLDLSEGGLQFFYRKKVKAGSILKMTLYIDENTKNIPVVAKVAWVKFLHGNYRIGVTFLEIDFDDQEIIRNFALKKTIR